MKKKLAHKISVIMGYTIKKIRIVSTGVSEHLIAIRHLKKFQSESTSVYQHQQHQQKT